MIIHRLVGLALVCIATSACTTSADRYTGLSAGQFEAVQTVTLNRPLEIAAGSAKAWLGEGGERQVGVRCYLETDQVRELGGDAVTIAPGQFAVHRATRDSSPLSLSRIRTLNQFNDTPSFYDTRYTLRVKADQRGDVLAFQCVETFNFADQVHYPNFQDLQQQAGDALSF